MQHTPAGFDSYRRAVVIAALLKDFGVPGVFTGITVFMLLVAVIIGAFGPRTNGLRLEELNR